MDIYFIRKELKTKSIFEVPMRVTYYARVSTDKEEQLTSLENQQTHYENLIKGNSNWEFVPGYIDEGLSAITTKKRERFHDMIADAKACKFDFIITKEITRFARNTLDSIENTRKLLSYGVGMLFQSDNINTLDEDSELRLTIMSGIAQDELRKLSSRIKFGHAQSIQKGVVMGNSRIYGYDKHEGALVKNEAEAEMVRQIFELYATGDYSTSKIENWLYAKGYRNYKGGKIDRNVVRKIITNPKYMGYYCGNKVKVIDLFTKKQKFLPPEEWVMYKDEDKVPAIVDEALWHKANKIFAERSNGIKSKRTNYKTSNLFTGKLVCAEHSTPFWLKQHRIRAQEPNPTWVCSHKIKNGAGSCSTIGVKENELVAILTEVLKELSSNSTAVIEKYLQFVKEAYAKSSVDEAVKEIDSSIDRLEQKKERLLDLNIDGKLSNVEFAKRNDKYNAEITQRQAEKQKLLQSRTDKDESISKIFQLKSELTRYHEAETVELTAGIVNTFVDKIYVTATGEGHLQLQIHLNTGATVTKAVGCYENITKKMIEAQERQMAGGSAVR